MPFQNNPIEIIINEVNHVSDVLSIKAKYDKGFSVRLTSLAKYKHIKGEAIPIKIENKIYVFRINFILFINKSVVRLYIISIIYNVIIKNYAIFIFNGIRGLLKFNDMYY